MSAPVCAGCGDEREFQPSTAARPGPGGLAPIIIVGMHHFSGLMPKGSPARRRDFDNIRRRPLSSCPWRNTAAAKCIRQELEPAPRLQIFASRCAMAQSRDLAEWKCLKCCDVLPWMGRRTTEDVPVCHPSRGGICTVRKQFCREARETRCTSKKRAAAGIARPSPRNPKVPQIWLILQLPLLPRRAARSFAHCTGPLRSGGSGPTPISISALKETAPAGRRLRPCRWT
jgi:hypothetical protein